MKRLLVGIARFFMNLLYKLCDLAPRRDEAVFFSRQANEPSVDFRLLGDELARRGFRVTYLAKKLSAKTLVPYCFFVVREIYHLARCRVCFLDRYDPVVCLLDFKCDPADGAHRDAGGEPLAEGGGTAAGTKPLHTEFPVQPLVIQLWHAYGAFKKFGYQSLGTIEGHTPENARIFRIHRNYSYVFCTGEDNRAAFAEAFSYPVERVVAMGRPELDVIAEEADLGAAGQEPKGQGGDSPHSPDPRPPGSPRRLKVLFAPTLRKSKRSQHPMVQLYESGSWKKLEQCADVVWSFHPLESAGVASGSLNEHMVDADIVVTDYSSIVYEAYLLGKEALFYVPDIEEYRVSPGLNVDPEKTCPAITCLDEEGLFSKVAALAAGDAYPQAQFDAFVGGTFAATGDATRSIADFACNHIGR